MKDWQPVIIKGSMQNAMYAARKEAPETEDIVNPNNQPIYDFCLEDGRTGWSQGPDALKELAAFGQAMIVQQRPGTGGL